MTRRYRTLFVGTLRQTTALSVGGSVGLSAVDSPVARDGRGRPTLRGTGIAGALLATLERMGLAIPREVSVGWGATHQAREALTESLWRVYNTHPSRDVVEVRPGVGHDQRTSSAADGLLYDVETIPRGTTWPFLLEVEHTPKDEDAGRTAARLAAAALLDWSRGFGFLGRDVVRGLGWVDLTDLEAIELNADAVTQWPDSSQPDPWAVVRRLRGHRVPAKDFEKLFEISDLEKRKDADAWTRIELRGTLTFGPSADGYGVDSLSLRGHATSQLVMEHAQWSDHLAHPPSLDPRRREDWFDPGEGLLMTRGAEGLEPFLPGASVRGPLRHMCSRLARGAGQEVADPNTHEGREALKAQGEAKADVAARLFGSMHHDGRLLVADAYLKPGTGWRAAILQHHAEDEFSAGVFSTAKFERLCLTEAAFDLRMVIEAPTEKEARAALNDLKPALARARAGQVAVGGGTRRGHGWTPWQIDSVRVMTVGVEGGRDEQL